MERSIFLVFVAFVCFLTMGCGNDNDADGDLDSGTTDSDTDTETNTYTDGDSDGDSDSDSDTDTDTDIYAGIDSGADAAADAGVTDCAGGRLDVARNLCWQHPKPSGGYKWQEAVDYCEALELAGQKDWVLPTRQDFIDMLGGCDAEILSGTDGYCESCASSDTCNALFGSDSGWHWSSSLADIAGAWFVDLGDGWVNRAEEDSDFLRVRCVRPEP